MSNWPNIRCDRCYSVLTDYGALVFSPPAGDVTVSKFHLCQKCYGGFLIWVKS